MVRQFNLYVESGEANMGEVDSGGEYVIIEDFQDLVKAFDALIAVAEGTHKMLAQTPEYTLIPLSQSQVVVLNAAVNNAITLLEVGVKEAREFE